MAGEYMTQAELVPYDEPQVQKRSDLELPLRTSGLDAMVVERQPAVARVWHKRLGRIVTISAGDFDPERHERVSV